MTCSACRRASADALCGPCRATLVPAPPRIVGPVLVSSAFTHEGAARQLVHRLKYGAVAGVARRLARAMHPMLPADAAALLPLPRVWLRRRRYGVDPARELALALGRSTGLPVVPALRSRAWHRRRAGVEPGRRRGAPEFELVRRVPSGAVLVDDVVTTGSTIAAAARALDVVRAITATSASRPRPWSRGAA